MSETKSIRKRIPCISIVHAAGLSVWLASPPVMADASDVIRAWPQHGHWQTEKIDVAGEAFCGIGEKINDKDSSAIILAQFNNSITVTKLVYWDDEPGRILIASDTFPVLAVEASLHSNEPHADLHLNEIYAILTPQEFNLIREAIPNSANIEIKTSILTVTLSTNGFAEALRDYDECLKH